MAINVTLGKPKTKTQEEKPFPKLMIGDDGITIIEVLSEPNNQGRVPVIHRAGLSKGRYTDSFRLFDGAVKFMDYNEPITIQNA